MAGGVALHFILGAAAFDQLWYVQERGFERAYIAETTGWIAVAAGVLGNLFGGMGGDWWQKRTGQGRATFLFWILLVLAPFNVLYRIVDPDTIWFWLGVFVGYFQLGAFYGPTLRLCPGAGAATDSRHRSSLLHPNVEPCGPGLWHYGRGNLHRLDARGRGGPALHLDLGGIHGHQPSGHAPVLPSGASLHR